MLIYEKVYVLTLSSDTGARVEADSTPSKHGNSQIQTPTLVLRSQKRCDWRFSKFGVSMRDF